MKRWWGSKLFWFALSGMVALGVVLYLRPGKKAESGNVGTVTRGELIQRVTIAGSVNPNRKTIISAPYTGYVRKLYVTIGDRVKEGDPIVSVSQSLRGGGEEVFPLRAPFTGTVVQILKTEGEYVDQGAAAGGLVRIDDLSRLYVEASAPELEVEKLKIGQETVIKASAVLGKTYSGRIERISLAAKELKEWDRSRVEFPVLIQVTRSDSQLKPGMSVIVDIVTQKVENALSVRHEFIQKDKDKFFVTTSTGQKKPVEVGLQNEEAFEIKSGVSEGEKLKQTDFLSVAAEGGGG